MGNRFGGVFLIYPDGRKIQAATEFQRVRPKGVRGIIVHSISRLWIVETRRQMCFVTEYGGMAFSVVFQLLLNQGMSGINIKSRRPARRHSCLFPEERFGLRGVHWSSHPAKISGRELFRPHAPWFDGSFPCDRRSSLRCQWRLDPPGGGF